MHAYPGLPRYLALGTLLVIGAAWAHSRASAAPAYTPISPTLADRTITLSGHDLTTAEVVAVARYGAQVQLSAAALQRENDNYGLLLEAAVEGVAVYAFNAAPGSSARPSCFPAIRCLPPTRHTWRRASCELSRTVRPRVTDRRSQKRRFVRAMLVVRANAMAHNAPSPQLSQMLLDLLNKRITPVVQSRGTVGEGDLAQLSNVGGTMVGAGDA